MKDEENFLIKKLHDELIDTLNNNINKLEFKDSYQQHVLIMSAIASFVFSIIDHTIKDTAIHKKFDLSKMIHDTVDTCLKIKYGKN